MIKIGYTRNSRCIPCILFLHFSMLSLFAQDYEVGVYYFPSYHTDTRNEKMHGKGWNEWELMKHASPRFSGHAQPKIPLWGYDDESDPGVMERKIQVADRYGIDFFIFDWYYYEGREFLNRALDEGYFQANNNQDVPFCLMWANHHWRELFPLNLNSAPLDWTASESGVVVWPGHVKGGLFENMTDLIIDKYFKHPAYYTISGAPYFSIFEIETFIAGFENEQEAVKAIQQFRQKTVKAGFPDLHLNIVGRGFGLSDNDILVERINSLAERMGACSVNMYNMVTLQSGEKEDWPKLSYDKVLDKANEFWESGIFSAFDVPYCPTISMGWDVSPRTVQSDRYENRGYPYSWIWTGNTPEKFKEGLASMKSHMDEHKQNTCVINAWNEWTEGSYLEPDISYGYQYLEAIREIFGKD